MSVRPAYQQGTALENRMTFLARTTTMTDFLNRQHTSPAPFLCFPAFLASLAPHQTCFDQSLHPPIRQLLPEKQSMWPAF